MKVSCSKIYAEIPFAHRQHNHKGHCSFIHGHNWSFEFQFTADRLDENGFVVDFGELKWLRGYLNDTFDHALILNESDPLLDTLYSCLNDPTSERLSKIQLVPNCGAEGLAAFLLGAVNQFLASGNGYGIVLPEDWKNRKLRVSKVTVYEDSKNSATVEAL